MIRIGQQHAAVQALNLVVGDLSFDSMRRKNYRTVSSALCGVSLSGAFQQALHCTLFWQNCDKYCLAPCVIFF
jgi:hypothetical protein